MRRSSLTARRTLLTALTVLAALVAVPTGAQAVVVNDQGTTAGVALAPVPGGSGGFETGASTGELSSAGVSTVTAGPPCSDPWLSSDLTLPDTGLCYHGGAVMHSNEPFALTWDPVRRYFAGTRNYLETFLSDVATGSGTGRSPYALAPQYNDTGGRAGNSSVFGGGCIDFGGTGGASCQFGNNNGTGPGHDYPSSGCTPTGMNQWHETSSGAFNQVPNDLCLTDAQLQGEVSTMVSQTGLLSHTQPGHTPLVMLLTPPGVVTCVDSAGNLCSANSAATARFCSYHSQVNVGGTEVSYVVQPWAAASVFTPTFCEDPDLQPIPNPVDISKLPLYAGQRLVSALSQAHLAAITNPGVSNGWFALDGSEINDNGCVPMGEPGSTLDQASVGGSSQNPYLLQREFNNAGAIEMDPAALRCTDWSDLAPTFVAPSAVNQGDEVQFDGSTTWSTLMVPKGNYAWNFGDGKTAVGPSVVHSYGASGTYSVKLTVTDRGGSTASFAQTVVVLGPSGQQPGGGVSGPGGFSVRLQLVPQGLRSVLRGGLVVRVKSNQSANGIASISISRKAARRAHIKAGRGPAVVIARGTLSRIANGTVSLRLRLPRPVAAKLRHLGHVTLTVRLALVGSSGNRLAIDAAGRY